MNNSSMNMRTPKEYTDQSLEQMIEQFHLKHRVSNGFAKQTSYLKAKPYSLKGAQSKCVAQSPLRRYNQTVADRTIEFIDQLERPKSPQSPKLRLDYNWSFSPTKKLNRGSRFTNANLDKYEQFTRLCRKNDKIRNIIVRERMSSPEKAKLCNYLYLKKF